MALTDWTPITPMHGRLLRRLWEQRAKEKGRGWGGLGWDVAQDGLSFRYVREDFYAPLLERAIVESCEAYMPGGKFFVRISDFGCLCLDFGVMPKAPVSGPDTLTKYRLEAESGALRPEAKTMGGKL